MTKQPNPHIPSLLEDGFNSDKSLGVLSKMLFDLDDESRKILGIIAQEGLVTEYQIAKKGLTKMLSREIVHRRLIGVDNPSKCLVENGFVKQTKGKNHRNTGKITKPYALTLKGMIACLGQVPFEGIFMVQKYQEMISSWSKNNERIGMLAIQVIKYDLGLFMVSNAITRSNFTYHNRIEANLYLFNDNDPLADPSYPQIRTKDKKIEDIFLKIRYRFFVSQQVFQTAYKEMTREPMERNVLSDYDDISILTPPKGLEFVYNMLPQYIIYWHEHMERIQFEDIAKFNPYVFHDDELAGTEINRDSIIARTLEILEQLKIPEPKHREFPLVWY